MRHEVARKRDVAMNLLRTLLLALTIPGSALVLTPARPVVPVITSAPRCSTGGPDMFIG